MATPKGWRAIKTVWYVVMSGVFVFACFASAMVMLGMAGSDNGQFWVGLGTLVVFWYAARTYRKNGLVLMDEALKEQVADRKDEDDE